MSRLAVDAVTLPANSGFTGCYQWLHSCLDNILGSKAGIELRLFTNDIITRQGYPEPTGQAKITPGFNLPSKYIIHTVGPAWIDGNHSERDILRSCYTKSLLLASELKCSSIAFPLISAGIFGYPLEQAWQVAVRACRDFISVNADFCIDIVFAVLDDYIKAAGEKILNDSAG